MQTAIAQGEIQRTELLLASKKAYAQSYTPFMDVDGQTKTLVLLRDITEEKLMQAETLRSVQLASVGELAAGVAHEINNPINGIINYAQVIQDESGENETLVKISEKIIREGERVAAIVSNLLSFARQQDSEFDKISISEVVFETAVALYEANPACDEGAKKSCQREETNTSNTTSVGDCEESLCPLQEGIRKPR